MIPEIIRLFDPKSIVDIGCWIGTFLHCCKESWITNILWIDGSWVDKELLSKYLSTHEFIEWDLGKRIQLEKKYDLVLSLEVAEHIHRDSADIFVSNLVSVWEIIIFSAAIPWQWGQNHINEQWSSYWENKFSQHNYIMHDVLKPLFWNNPKIDWWYKQNIVLYTPRWYILPDELSQKNHLKNVIHPEQFSYMQYRLEQAEKKLQTLVNKLKK